VAKCSTFVDLFERDIGRRCRCLFFIVRLLTKFGFFNTSRSDAQNGIITKNREKSAASAVVQRTLVDLQNHRVFTTGATPGYFKMNPSKDMNCEAKKPRMLATIDTSNTGALGQSCVASNNRPHDA